MRGSHESALPDGNEFRLPLLEGVEIFTPLEYSNIFLDTGFL